MRLVLFVALGGALGAAARYLLGGWVQRWGGTAFPWGTLAVNLLGCLLLGLLIRLLDTRMAGAGVRAFATVGILGGFTTFSTFSLETVQLVQGGEHLKAALYVAASVGLGFLAMRIGLAGQP